LNPRAVHGHSSRASTSGEYGRVPLGLQDLDHQVTMVALDLDQAIELLAEQLGSAR
jgi:hypothetical protein